MKNYPNYEECLAILHGYPTPEHVIGHCFAVAATARCLARALNEKGFDLDVDLTFAAGMLHDIARVHEDHQKVGADYIRELGWPDVADIIAVHMTYPKFNEPEETDETDLVCLGDRVCKFDQYVGVDERMEYIIDKHHRDPKVEARIYANKHFITDYIAGLEAILGRSVDEILKEDPDVPYAKGE